MTGPTRVRIGRSRWPIAIITALIAVVGAQLALVVAAGATTSFTRSGETAAAYAGDRSRTDELLLDCLGHAWPESMARAP